MPNLTGSTFLWDILLSRFFGELLASRGKTLIHIFGGFLKFFLKFFCKKIEKLIAILFKKYPKII